MERPVLVATSKSDDLPNPQLKRPKLLIAASGTGGHLFPALAVAEALPEYQIEWLGVPDRLETQLVPDRFPLHTISVGGFQQRLGLSTLRTFSRLVLAIFKVRRLLQRGGFEAVFTTGGYIAAPAVVAARTLGLPVVLHESNALPGKVTRWLSGWCTVVALGFEVAACYLPKAKTVWVGTPVRDQFQTDLSQQPLSGLAVPDAVPLILVVGGSQGAVAMNRLVRQAAPAWFGAGAWVVHLTGENDPDANSLSHPQYIALPFYHDMAKLMQRATLAVSRAGAGTLTELAITGTPAILIPFPYAAEDHQTHNARVFESAGAAFLYQQSELTPELLQQQVLNLLHSSEQLQSMAEAAKKLAVTDSAKQLADLIRQFSLVAD
ncbi:undecaprenyldiphospho-muramoylpentapeptide beta-N-acetylglucosaminyltransferase [Leptolyngbya sp. NK1-12]|uniref:UDP-N-acetylglucosamine--N-acetylmuramyl-(pentapeptide) pyrophosphoryl-undecaprenol N-acetylglucosamine transferase n=1 Tax=Leptolyngbya sp. NK1-12 TaxID=2547451 RepID=A0AA96WTY2_9CYAN|nr:undecaprenyldiphospho-muramoylpentapeptide beta-N-acetylglucosaminyltransferase [Leptolyngbya sp. NK1-12]WNZ23022.1 undecaprenyldiphospho-muramoylpentapeptide beta-N-acetylglucosaminyltransferase [Leptolyngbya sp. NK1-12]